MKKTSPVSRLERMAARSPGRSRAGPEVTRIFTSNSLAMTPASVVFPSPGGAWRTVRGRVVASLARCVQRDLETLPHAVLPDELIEMLGAECDLLVGFDRRVQQRVFTHRYPLPRARRAALIWVSMADSGSNSPITPLISSVE